LRASSALFPEGAGLVTPVVADVVGEVFVAPSVSAVDAEGDVVTDWLALLLEQEAITSSETATMEAARLARNKATMTLITFCVECSLVGFMGSGAGLRTPTHYNSSRWLPLARPPRRFSSGVIACRRPHGWLFPR
jgi:hypothetical protein